MMWCSSQNIYPKLVNDSLVVITPQQLKSTNLIFSEHKKLSLEVSELGRQLTAYENLIDSYKLSDSIRNAQVNELLLYSENYKRTIESQIKEINRLKLKNNLYKGFTVGGITISVGLLTALLLK